MNVTYEKFHKELYAKSSVYQNMKPGDSIRVPLPFIGNLESRCFLYPERYYIKAFLMNYYFYDFDDLPDPIIQILYQEDVRKAIVEQNDKDDTIGNFDMKAMQDLLNKYRMIFYTLSSRRLNTINIIPEGFDVNFIYYYNECKRDVPIGNIDKSKPYLKYLIYYFDSIENFKLLEDEYDNTYTIFRPRKIFQYALDHNLFQEEHIPFFCATHNELELLKGYVETTDEIPERWINYMCDAAVRYNSIDCLKYLHQKGCRLENQSVLIAASEGHLESLKYLHKNGCILTSECSYLAHRNQNTKCLDYLMENGCDHYSLYVKDWGDY